METRFARPRLSARRRFVGRARALTALTAVLLAAVLAGACGRSIAPTPDPTLAALMTQVARQGTFIAYLATQVGADRRPPTQPPPPPTEYSPVTGSVLLEDGRCCILGQAGATVEIHADFEAASPFSEVTQMRLIASGRPAGPEDFEAVAWEGYQPSKSFLAEAALNWLGFFVSVQFRDAQGYVSPIYTDDISIEGFVPRPT